MTWLRRILVVWSILLVPSGGPCDRWTRPADPMTAPGVPIGCGPVTHLLGGDDGPGGDVGLVEMSRAILDDDDDDSEEFETRCADERPLLAAPRRLSAVPGMGSSGRSARSPILRC